MAPVLFSAAFTSAAARLAVPQLHHPALLLGAMQPPLLGTQLLPGSPPLLGSQPRQACLLLT